MDATSDGVAPSPSTYASIDHAIVEYLSSQGMQRTADLFAAERARMPPFDQHTIANQRKQKLMAQFEQWFDAGDADSCWTMFSTRLKTTPETSLTFSLHVYFAIYPILRPNNKEQLTIQQSMDAFREFLHVRSQDVDVAQTPEILPFYALPFVKDPRTHPSFRQLFNDIWANDLRTEYLAFIDHNLVVPEHPTPVLVKLFMSGGRPSVSMRHATIGMSPLRTVLPPAATITRNAGPYPVVGINLRLITYRLCHDESLDPLRISTLLQAIRWNLTQSPNQATRRQVLDQYIQSDLLCCTSNGVGQSNARGNDDLLGTLLSMDDQLVKDSTLRLISAIATYYSGRTYLLSHGQLIPLLCMSMTGEANPNTDIHLNSLCTLQKISMRRLPETQMIELGVIEYLGRLLSDHSRLSRDTIEYGTALLFNLALRTNGKIAFENSSIDMISLLNELLEIDNDQVRHYICGTLHAVLMRPALLDKAISLGTADALKQNIDSRDRSSDRQQLAIILHQLSGPMPCDSRSALQQSPVPSDNEDADDISEQDDDEQIDEEFEEDLDDELADIEGVEHRGEVLLHDYMSPGGVKYPTVNRKLDYTPDTDRDHIIQGGSAGRKLPRSQS